MGGQATILLEWIAGEPANEERLRRLRQAVEEVFAMPVECRVVSGPPGDTWDARRQQRLSTKVLRWLLERHPSDPGKVLAITDSDLFIPVLTFVFGEAQVGGHAAVVSTARLRQTYDGRPAHLDLVEVRLIKECLHELGHTFGLVHCADPACAMSRSNTVLDIDQKRTAFCHGCAESLDERTRAGESP
jgi:archaemetzincin